MSGGDTPERDHDGPSSYSYSDVANAKEHGKKEEREKGKQTAAHISDAYVASLQALAPYLKTEAISLNVAKQITTYAREAGKQVTEHYEQESSLEARVQKILIDLLS